MTCAETAALAVCLGRLGGWNLASCVMLERKLHDGFKSRGISPEDFSQILAATINAKFYLNWKHVAEFLCNLNTVDPKIAARALWAIHAGDLMTSPPSRYSDKWDDNAAAIAKAAEPGLLSAILQSENCPGDLEFWTRVSEIFEFTKAEVPEKLRIGIEWAKTENQRLRTQDRLSLDIFSVLGESPSPTLGLVSWVSADGVAIVADVAYSHVTPALQLEICKRNFQVVHVVDPISYYSRIDREEWLRQLSTSTDPVTMPDASLLSEPPIVWDSEEIKIPATAMRFSVRRANSPFLK